MNNSLEIYMPQNQPALEAAILQFLQEEFHQTASFRPVPADEQRHKDISGILGVIGQVIEFVVVVEGVLQFSERMQRYERVKKLQQAIVAAGKPVYLRIKDQTIDLYQKTVDQIMDLLAEVDDNDDAD